MSGLDRRAVAGQLIAGRWRVSTELSRTDLYNAYVVRGSDGTLGRMVVMGTDVVTRAELWAHCVQAARSASTPAMAEIPSVLDDGIDETLSSPYLVTEHVTWPTLTEHVSTSAGLSPQSWASVLGAIAPALDAAHRRGVVHRGLTPNAVLVSEENLSSVKILDFGLGVLRAAIPPPPGWAGPPGWVGPDGADPAVRPTPATDVFALGLISFYALTGRPAFRALSQPAIDYDALWREMIEPLGSASLAATELGLRLDPNLDEWFARALAPQPRQRFGSIGAMARAFGETLKKVGIDEGEPPAAQRRPRKKTLVGPGPAPEPAAPAGPPPLPARAMQRSAPMDAVEGKRRVATPEPAPRVATPESLVEAPPSDKTTSAEGRPGIVSVSVQPLAFAQLPGRASDPEVVEQPPVSASAAPGPGPGPAPAPPPAPSRTIAAAPASPAELVSSPGRAPMPTVPEVEDAPLGAMAAQRGPSGWRIALLLTACFLIGGGAAALLWKQQRDARVAEIAPMPAPEPTPSALVVAPPVPLPEAAAEPIADAVADQTSTPIGAADASADAAAVAAADAAVRAKPRVAAAPTRAPEPKPAPTAKPTEKPAAADKPKATPAAKPKPRPKKEEQPCGTFINPCK